MNGSKKGNGEWSSADMINTILVYENGYSNADYCTIQNPICIVRTKDLVIFDLIMERFRLEKEMREKHGERNSCVEVTVAELKGFIDNHERSGVKGFEYMMWKIDQEIPANEED